MADLTVKISVDADEVPLIQANLEYTEGIAIVGYQAAFNATRWRCWVTLSCEPEAAKYLYTLGKYVGTDMERSRNRG